MTKKLNPKDIKKILVLSLSNLGDIILTFPVIDILRSHFDHADLAVMVGPKGKPLLIDNPRIEYLYVYNKKMPLKNKWHWLCQIRKERFDLVVDLRHSIFPLLLMPKYRTSLTRRRIDGEHVRDQHLRCLYSVFPADLSKEHFCFSPTPEDRDFVDGELHRQIQSDDPVAVIAPGAADHRKRWTEEGFACVADRLAQDHGLRVVFIGDENDSVIISRIMARMRTAAIDFSGRCTVVQSGLLIQRAKIVIVNDSAPMHLASYLGSPVVALFGPTDPVRYGPWGDWSGFIRHNDDCMACREKIPDAEHSCMEMISAEEVVSMAERLLNPRF